MFNSWTNTVHIITYPNPKYSLMLWWSQPVVRFLQSDGISQLLRFVRPSYDPSWAPCTLLTNILSPYLQESLRWTQNPVQVPCKCRAMAYSFVLLYTTPPYGYEEPVFAKKVQWLHVPCAFIKKCRHMQILLAISKYHKQELMCSACLKKGADPCVRRKHFVRNPS